MHSGHPMLLLALLFSLRAGRVLGHLELLFPPGINSKFDPQTPFSQIDYSMKSPLDMNGDNYPCKGYNTAANIANLHPVATLVAGNDFSVNISGTATHEGGSCQFSLSYDGGKTFAVIESIIGGCPLALEYTFTVPQDVPANSKALFAWTWFNLVGNREEYMNCAVVAVQGSSSSYTSPAIFRANTFTDGTCITIEGAATVFPNPGKQVQYGGSSTSSSPVTPLTPCAHNELVEVTLKSDGSSTFPSSLPSSASSSASTTSKSGSTNTKSGASGATQVLQESTASASTHTTVTTTTTTSKPIASDTQTTIPSAATTSASSSGVMLRCTSSTTFSLCDGPTCTPMGDVAPGTECVNGAIQAIGKRRSRRSAHYRSGMVSHGRL